MYHASLFGRGSDIGLVFMDLESVSLGYKQVNKEKRAWPISIHFDLTFGQ